MNLIDNDSKQIKNSFTVEIKKKSVKISKVSSTGNVIVKFNGDLAHFNTSSITDYLSTVGIFMKSKSDGSIIDGTPLSDKRLLSDDQS